MFFNFPFGGGTPLNGNGFGPEMFFGTDDDGFPHMNMDDKDIDNNKDYYKILGIDEKANEDEIKKAYRKLSMMHHPDKNGNTDESKQKFQELNNAYATLSDANKRRTYDMMRKGSGGGIGGGIGGMPNIFQFGGSGGARGGMPPGIPEELLHMLFGSAAGGHGPGLGPKVVFQTFHNGRMNGGFTTTHHGQQQQQAQQQPSPTVRVYQVPETIVKTVSLTLEQCYNGCSIPLEIDRQVPDNDIIKIERETIHAQIPKGVLQGDTIILNECGHMNEAGMKGDIRIIINVLQHALFKVENLDLTIEKTIPLKAALCGFDFEITHLNGRIFKLANKPGNIIKPGSIKTIPGLGLEKGGESGVLKIKFNIEFPDTLTNEQIQALQVGL